MIVLREAEASEASDLTELCLRSKAVWGYSSDFLRACVEELTITPEMMNPERLMVATDQDRAVGLVQIEMHGQTCSLEKLFVDSDVLRSGIGRTMYDWARTTAKRLGAEVLVIDADPEAAAFYRRMGAVDAGSAPSASIPGRRLPRLNALL